jgi:hypothetical protein
VLATTRLVLPDACPDSPMVTLATVAKQIQLRTKAEEDPKLDPMNRFPYHDIANKRTSRLDVTPIVSDS